MADALMIAHTPTPGTVGNWYADLSADARGRVRLALRDLGGIAEVEWGKARERGPRVGERPAGSAFFDHVMRAQQIEDFNRAIWDGEAPTKAAETTRAKARGVIAKHNTRCPDDPVIRPGWLRDPESGHAWIDAMVSRVERAVGQIDLDADAAQLVWAGLWRQMEALQAERDAVHYERRPLDLIDADFARLAPVLRAVRAAGAVVSEATLNDMLKEYGL